MSDISKEKIFEINECAADYFQYFLTTKEGKTAFDYLHQDRKMTDDCIAKYRLGFSPNSNQRTLFYLRKKGFSDKEIAAANLSSENKMGEMYSTFRNRIMIPIFNENGKIIGFGGRCLPGAKVKAKYLNTSETEVFKKKKTLFSLNFAIQSNQDYLILTEGFFDVISLNTAGFENTVATLGTALTAEQATMIASYTDKVIILYDSDEPGLVATDKAIDTLRNAGLNLRILNVKDAKDPDEYLKKYGAKAFETLIVKDSKTIEEYKINRIIQKNDTKNSHGAFNTIQNVLGVLLSEKFQ